MKKIFRLISLMALSVLALSACKKEKLPEYVPAEKPATAEVYFANNLPAAYDLNGKTSFAVKVNRVNTGSALTVNVTSGADPLFTIPSSVTFAPDAAVADLVITFEDGSLAPGTDYKFDFSLSDETSIYGNTAYSCTASIPAAWVKWKKGHMTEVWWGEEEDEYMYVQDLGDGLFYCYIENCYDTEGGADPTNVYFYWDKNTNKCKIPMQYMGWANGGIDVYFGDAEAFYLDYYDGEEIFIKNGYKGAADFAYNYNGDIQPYYDGNGGFYLADYFFYCAADKKGSGFQFGGDKDEFIAEGFDRKTDYNTAYDYKALWTADVKSEAFDAEWEDQAVRLYFDEDKPIDKDDEDKAIYYLSDYFDEGYGLAFIAHHPETLAAEGEVVYGVANEQFTGVTLFGQKLYAEVKGGKVLFEEGEDYPKFEIKLSMYTEGEDGSKITNFGSFVDTLTVTGELQEWYSVKDLYGLNRSTYFGNLTMYAEDYFNSRSVSWNFSIADGGNGYVLFKGFAPYNTTAIPNNVFKIKWSSSDGMLHINKTSCEGPFIYQGAEHELIMYPADSKSVLCATDNNTEVIAGYYPDEANELNCLVFVNNPDNSDFEANGVYFALDEPSGGLAMFYNLIAVWNDEEASSVTSKAGWSVWKSSENKSNNGLSQSARMTFGAKVQPEVKSAKRNNVNRSFNHTPVENTKNLELIQANLF